MDKNLGKQLIQAGTALACVISLCISANSIFSSFSDAKIEMSKAAVSQTDETFSDDAAAPDAFESGSSETGNAGSSTEAEPSAPTDGTEATPDGSADPGTDASKPASKPASTVPQSKADIIKYCNTALNKVKTSKPGFHKKQIMKVEGDTTGIPSSLTKLVTKDKTTEVKKGEDNTDIFPAAGFSWSSKLREQDVQSASLKQNGKYYEITLKLGNEINPAKGEKSSYGRIMSVIDANDAKDMLPGIKKIKMTYHDGYVYAKIDSTTGKVVKAELSATADIEASIAIIGDIAVKDIISTETFTDFKW